MLNYMKPSLEVSPSVAKMMMVSCNLLSPLCIVQVALIGLEASGTSPLEIPLWGRGLWGGVSPPPRPASDSVIWSGVC